MILYKGTDKNNSPFQPQPVHNDDIKKFPEPTPEGVIFATDSETHAKIFAVFSGIVSFGTVMSPDEKKRQIILRGEIREEDLEEKVYVHEFDSEEGDWKYIKESGEWYSTEEQIPSATKEYTRRELYKELQENSEIEFVQEFEIEGDLPLS